MKKVIILVLVLALTLIAFAGCGNNNELETKLAEAQKILDNSKVYPQEPFTSASKPVAKYDLGVTPQELADMGTSFKGTYLFVSVNPDGTPNAGYMIYSVQKVGDKFYTSQRTGHQTGANLLREKGGLAIWIDQHESKKSLPDSKDATKSSAWTTRGIKMTLKLTEDATVRTALGLKDEVPAYEIVSYIPIG